MGATCGIFQVLKEKALGFALIRCLDQLDRLVLCTVRMIKNSATVTMMFVFSDRDFLFNEIKVASLIAISSTGCHPFVARNHLFLFIYSHNDDQ